MKFASPVPVVQKLDSVSTRPQLFERWIALSGGQISIQWIVQLVSQILIC